MLQWRYGVPSVGCATRYLCVPCRVLLNAYGKSRVNCGYASRKCCGFVSFAVKAVQMFDNPRLIIDSSQSMTNPRQELSYAVLGAGCACDAYLRHEARVAVYNFSDADAGGRKILPFSDNRRDIYRGLCHYFGGGTRLGVAHIEALQNDDVPDIFLITDMQITNLKRLIEYFNVCENRVTAVHIGDNKHVHTFRRSMDAMRNVEVFAVENRRDIPRIVLGRIKDYFY